MKRIIALTCILLMISAVAFSEGIAISEYTYVNGIKCRPRQNLLTYLFIGVDETGTVHQKDSYDGHGQSDVLALLVIDKAADTYAVVTINRDTITPVHSIAEDGTDLGAYPVQISLAHAQGDGMQISCENTVEAVSELFLGIQIDHYAAVTMDVIGILNHAIGGVEVTIRDDLSAYDSEMKVGSTVLLSDAQAVLYIRSRQGVGDGSNEARMMRQQDYLLAAKPKLLEKYHENKSFPLDLVHSMNAYMVTDMTDKDFSYIAKAINSNSDLGIFTLSGHNEIDSDGWKAFYPSEDSITDLVVTLFYKRVEE